MRLAVVWHKAVWPAPDSPSGWASRGCLGDPGFGGLPAQVRAISELFDRTRLVAPCSPTRDPMGEVPVEGASLAVVPLAPLPRSGAALWAALPSWLMRNGATLAREVRRADAVLACVPSPIGFLGLALALALRRPLLVRHLNAWSDPRLIWKLERTALEAIAGAGNVVFANGASDRVPSRRNPAVAWLFVTSLTGREIEEAASGRDARGPMDHPKTSESLASADSAGTASTRADRPGADARAGEGAFRLVSVARDLEPRGTRRLLEAVRLLSADGPDVRLDLLGDGPAASACRRMADRLGVSGVVTFHGSVSRERLLRLLGDASLLCLAAEETEGSRHGLHEALACGVPVVATATAAPVGLIEGCGVVVPDPSPQAFADGVRACLVDGSRHRRLSAAAVATARRHSLERWRATLREALESAWGPLATGSPPPAGPGPFADDRPTERETESRGSGRIASGASPSVVAERASGAAGRAPGV